MPKYIFECVTCNVRFDRMLKMGEHPTHGCPKCKDAAPRVWDGQSLSFSFATSAGTPKANTGVTKNDYPTADNIVGRSAEARWAEYKERAEIKEKVRQGGGTEALIRKHGPNNSYVEYEAMTPQTLKARKKLFQEAKKVEQAASGTEDR